jgi:CP family cyanate transporter-like MFS transporter
VRLGVTVAPAKAGLLARIDVLVHREILALLAPSVNGSGDGDSRPSGILDHLQTEHHPTSPPTAGALPLVALLIVALATRPQLSAIGPLAPGIIRELGTPYAFVGLLTTIPVLCMGIFAPVGPGIVHMLGVRAGIAASVGLLLLFAILRPFAPAEASLLILTFGIGVGTALAGPMLPMFVRGRLSVRMVAGTAAYASGTIIGAAIASAIAVPLETALGGWRASLLAISLACLPALILWIVLVRKSPVGLRRASSAARKADHGSTSRVMSRLPIQRPIAWVIGSM